MKFRASIPALTRHGRGDSVEINEPLFIFLGAKEGNDMAETTVKGFFESLESKLNSDPSKLAGMDAVYQFQVGEGTYCVTMKEGKASVASASAPDPNCTVTMAENDFLEMLAGKLNSQMAFMTGKLKVAGDMGLALKLESFLKA
jgi:putative sterol carrier protein